MKVRRPKLMLVDCGIENWFRSDESIEERRAALKRLQADDIILCLTPIRAKEVLSAETPNIEVLELLESNGIIVPSEIPIHYFDERLSEGSATPLSVKVHSRHGRPESTINWLYREYFLKYALCAAEILVSDKHILSNLLTESGRQTGAMLALNSLAMSTRSQTPIDLREIGDETVKKIVSLETWSEISCDQCRNNYPASCDCDFKIGNRIWPKMEPFGEHVELTFNRVFRDFHMRSVNFYFIPFMPHTQGSRSNHNTWQHLGFTLSKGLEAFQCPKGAKQHKTALDCSCMSPDPLVGLLDEDMLQIVNSHMSEKFFPS